MSKEQTREANGLAQLFEQAANAPAYQTVVAHYTADGTPAARVSHYQHNGADLVIEDVHTFPHRPAIMSSASPMWMQCTTTGNYPTLEDHLAGRTPRYYEQLNWTTGEKTFRPL